MYIDEQFEMISSRLSEQRIERCGGPRHVFVSFGRCLVFLLMLQRRVAFLSLFFNAMAKKKKKSSRGRFWGIFWEDSSLIYLKHYSKKKCRSCLIAFMLNYTPVCHD